MEAVVLVIGIASMVVAPIFLFVYALCLEDDDKDDDD